MSRLGRDYLKVGYYTEISSMERDVRYIAINDGADSAKGDDDFTSFRNLFNDFYAKDISKKVWAIKRVQKVDIVFNFVGEVHFLSDAQPKRQGA